jgi:glutamate-1-semialdehyde 2,1-aminomutase
LPLALLCGRKDLMRHAEIVHGGTFGGDVLSLAACNAVLDVYEKEPVIETLWKRGEQLQKYFNASAARLGLSAFCDGFPCKPRIAFPIQGTAAPDSRQEQRALLEMSLFLQETAAQGVLFHPVNCNVSAALTDRDMATTFRAVDAALNAVGKAVQTDDWTALTGNPIKPVVPLRT